MLEVRDHGPGVPDDAGDELFERFWRSEGGRSRGKGGAGLGLAIVKAIAVAHGGSVSAGNVADADGGGRGVPGRAARAPRRRALSGKSQPSHVGLLSGSRRLSR